MDNNVGMIFVASKMLKGQRNGQSKIVRANTSADNVTIIQSVDKIKASLAVEIEMNMKAIK